MFGDFFIFNGVFLAWPFMTFSNGSQGAKLLQSSFKRTLLSLRENVLEGWKGLTQWLGFRLVKRFAMGNPGIVGWYGVNIPIIYEGLDENIPAGELARFLPTQQTVCESTCHGFLGLCMVFFADGLHDLGQERCCMLLRIMLGSQATETKRTSIDLVPSSLENGLKRPFLNTAIWKTCLCVYVVYVHEYILVDLHACV